MAVTDVGTLTGVVSSVDGVTGGDTDGLVVTDVVTEPVFTGVVTLTDAVSDIGETVSTVDSVPDETDGLVTTGIGTLIDVASDADGVTGEDTGGLVVAGVREVVALTDVISTDFAPDVGRVSGGDTGGLVVVGVVALTDTVSTDGVTDEQAVSGAAGGGDGERRTAQHRRGAALHGSTGVSA